MGNAVLLHFLCGVLAVFSASLVNADDPYRYYTWTVTYGTVKLLDVPQQVILINGQFPGPRLDVVTNDNIILNLFNKLDQPFLLTWNGIKQRKNSWQDGVLGTNCPIPPNSNYTYKFQTKDQIGSFTYFPSTLFHKAAGGYGAINIYERPRIPIPFPVPDGDFTLLIGDWYKSSHKTLQAYLDSGRTLSFPDGVLINGQTYSTFSGDQGKTYMFRISNVGMSTSLNFRIQGHSMKLVEVEGSHTVQNMKNLTTTAILHYSNSRTPASGPLPAAPSYGFHGSMMQARTYRWNLTASAARPNPQGSYHYGKITPTKTIVLANSAPLINGKAVDSIESSPSGGAAFLSTSVMSANLHDFLEIVFQNDEITMQSWHLDGYDFWVIGYGNDQWTPAKRSLYNLDDALTRHTVQVYPKSWTAIYVSLDNQGMWNMRSAIWERQYLGQQFYLRVWTQVHSLANEYEIPPNALRCGKAIGIRS
ncbi:MULTI-COPPER OXIDASE [Salix koriyanagi]|uniref:MULTI-COPPER OXIDASE n=1 Tax=Salix koriyanagi TaxID=2511006 RepID=A0A9Q0ZFW5_9ROSI|nr:MULTI-COPPER OXIDASE [Salix koriyanagi]